MGAGTPQSAWLLVGAERLLLDWAEDCLLLGWILALTISRSVALGRLLGLSVLPHVLIWKMKVIVATL